MMVLQAVDLSKSADFIFIVRKRYLNKTFEENLKALQELSAKIMFKLDKEV
jgi:ribonuclease P protein component